MAIFSRQVFSLGKPQGPRIPNFSHPNLRDHHRLQNWILQHLRHPIVAHAPRDSFPSLPDVCPSGDFVREESRLAREVLRRDRSNFLMVGELPHALLIFISALSKYDHFHIPFCGCRRSFFECQPIAEHPFSTFSKFRAFLRR